MYDYKEYYAELNRKLSQRIEGLSIHLLGEPVTRSSNTWRFGERRELMVTIAGEKRGRYWNFETSEGGSALDLIASTHKLSGKDLCQWATNWLGSDVVFLNTRSRTEITWEPMFPVPENTPSPDFTRAPLNSLLEGRKIEALYAYRNEKGQLLGYVARIKDPKVGKIVPMLTYCQASDGSQSWKWKGFGENRHPYGLEFLAQDPNKRILIVEGEKTADAARLLFPNLCVITWSGGVVCVLKTDWSSLKGRSVVIWPDNDEPGKKAALKLKDHLKNEYETDSEVVDLPDDLPIGWDLADDVVSEEVRRVMERLNCLDSVEKI